LKKRRMDIVGIVGTLASVASLLVAMLQTIRLRELRRRNNADIWKLIFTADSIRGRLESSPAFKQGEVQLHQIYGRVVEQFRDLLKMAILDERHFTEHTIRLWRLSGKLTNDWESAQARRWLETREIRDLTPTKPVDLDQIKL
jgi:hypothetical protein